MNVNIPSYKDYSPKFADTPPRASIVTNVLLAHQTVNEMKKLVDLEIAENFHLADTDQFLATFFPVDGVPAIEKEVEKRYTEKYLRNFAVECEGKTESAFYAPFVDATNNILQCCPSKLGVHSYWITRADDTPKTTDETSAMIRPDAAAVLGDQRSYFRACEMLRKMSTSSTDAGQQLVRGSVR